MKRNKLTIIILVAVLLLLSGCTVVVFEQNIKECQNLCIENNMTYGDLSYLNYKDDYHGKCSCYNVMEINRKEVKK